MESTEATPEINTLFVNRPDAFDDAEFRNLVVKAFERNAPTDAETAIMELSRLIPHNGLAIMASKENGKFVALAVLMLPSCGLFQEPQVYHFYSCGSRSARESIFASMVSWFVFHGHSTFLTSTPEIGRDKAFRRLLKSLGSAVHTRNIYRFNMEDSPWVI